MSLRLDPRRLGTLKQLAAEAGMRPGDLVRQWVEERIDAERGGATRAAPTGLADRFAELVERVAALEIAAGIGQDAPTSADTVPTSDAPEEVATDAATEGSAREAPAADAADAAATTDPSPAEPGGEAPARAEPARRTTRKTSKRVSAAPVERVALHEEMIAVIRERGPLTAAELAAAITERGRYAPPRSGKPLDAAMVSQRVSNPTYRARFTRDGGRIGLAEIEGT